MADIEEYYGIYCDKDGSALMEAMNADEDYAYDNDDFQNRSNRKKENNERAKLFGRNIPDSEVPF